MSIEVDHTITEIDCDVTVTDVDGFTNMTENTRYNHDFLDIYLEDHEGHTINLEMDIPAAADLFLKLQESEYIKEELASRDSHEPATAES